MTHIFIAYFEQRVRRFANLFLNYFTIEFAFWQNDYFWLPLFQMQ